MKCSDCQRFAFLDNEIYGFSQCCGATIIAQEENHTNGNGNGNGNGKERIKEKEKEILNKK